MSAAIFRRMFLVSLISIPLLLFSFSYGFGADSVTSKIVLTTDMASSENQETFTPYDTIYALVTVSGMPSGTYTADISWANSAGTVNRYNSTVLDIAPNSPFTFYSWFRLLKNGPLKSTLTGENFSENSLGNWVLIVSIEGFFSKTVEFEIL